MFRIVVPVEKLKLDPDWAKWVGVQEVSLMSGNNLLKSENPLSGQFGWVPADLC